MATPARPDMDPHAAFVGSQVFERLFSEGMSLVEETAAYLDGTGRSQSKHLPRELGLMYAATSMDLSTRLMQAASWLVMQKAVHDGEMTPLEARDARYRLNRGVPLHPDAALDPDFRALVARSERLFERLCRLDQQLYHTGGNDDANPVSRQIEALKRAAQSGAFDPLSVWKR